MAWPSEFRVPLLRSGPSMTYKYNDFDEKMDPRLRGDDAFF